MAESRTARSAKLRNEARRKRSQSAARTFGDPLLIGEAKQLEQQANSLMALETRPEVMSGEIVPAFNGSDSLPLAIRDTLQRPSQVTADASLERMSLLVQPGANCVELALDAAQSVGAANSLEKMLAHQMAASHNMAMKYQAKALELLGQLDTRADPLGRSDGKLNPHLSQESTRLAHTALRCITAFQEGMLTLQRMRTGGKQTVVVQHVTVQSGGQAAIGNLQTGGSTLPGESRKNGQ